MLVDSEMSSGGSTLGLRGGTQAPQVVARPPNPKFSAVLLTHCSQLILRKISKFDATRCQILRLKYANLIFAGGAYSAPPDPLAVFKGLASKGRKAKPASPKYFGLELPWKCLGPFAVQLSLFTIFNH